MKRDELEGGKIKSPKIMIVLAVAAFVLTRFYILFVLRPWLTDVPLYFQYAAKAVDFHQTPYQGGFEVNGLSLPYPPLTFWTMCLPRLLDDRRIASAGDPQIPLIYLDYRQIFRGLMFLCDLASFVLILRIIGKRRPSAEGWSAFLYALTTALLGHLLYDRLDAGLLALLMSWAYVWTQSIRESEPSIFSITSAYALIGLGIGYKIVPVFCVPFLLVAELHCAHRWSRLSAALAALAVGVGSPFAVQYAVSGPSVFALFRHHVNRGIQIESLYSTAMMIFAYFGAQISIGHSDGSYILSGDLSQAMKTASIVISFMFLAGMGFWALWRGARYSRRDAYCFSLYAVLGAMILSNALSPQYFIWTFPLLLLLAVEVLPPGRLSVWMLGILMLAVAAWTTWLCPYHYFCSASDPRGLVPIIGTALSPSPVAYIVLGLRNLTCLGVIAWLGAMLYCRIDEDSAFVRPRAPARD